jgi:hypothetical protein
MAVVTMAPSEQQVRGYVLEDILAFLIRNSGYNLLPDASYDPQELIDQPNGLAVRGRGATHQADVLGQLTWIPAFTYPLRLFVEAKYYSRNRVGLSAVRAAVGILEDVNQNFQVVPGATSVLLRRRYTYRYALFSATGFDVHAAEYAYAHDISLVDLSTPAFTRLRDAVSLIAASVNASQHNGNVIPLPALRQAVREALETAGEGRRPWGPVNLPPEVAQVLLQVRNRSEFADLLIGVPDAPFVLVLQPDDLGSFLHYAREHRRHQVFIGYDFRGAATEWVLRPRESNAYRLVFSLPPTLDEWILAADSSASARARDLKGELLKSITVFWSEEGYEEIFRLEYSRNEARSRIR